MKACQQSLPDQLSIVKIQFRINHPDNKKDGGMYILSECIASIKYISLKKYYEERTSKWIKILSPVRK
jgi:hypothetical protein